MSTVRLVHDEFLYDEFPNCPSCHASSIVETPDGTLLSGCFAGSKESGSDTVVLLSRKEAGSNGWETHVHWDEPDHAAGNVRLFERPDGNLQIIYALNYGKWCRGGSRLFQQTSADGGKTWSEQVAIPCDPPLLGKNRPILLGNGSLVMPMTIEGEKHGSAALMSGDGGDTWEKSQEIQADDGTDVLQPTAVELQSGDVLFLHRTDGGRIYRSTSSDDGYTWTAAEPTALPNNHSGIDVAKLSDGRMVLAYNPVEKSWGPRTPLAVALSEDDGETFERALTLEDQPGEYSYPTVIQTRNGLVHATYTYLRKKIKHVVLQLE